MSFNIWQGGWIPTKRRHLYDSGHKFAPCHMLRGAASSYSPPLLDTISPWIFRVEKNVNIQNIVTVNMILDII